MPVPKISVIVPVYNTEKYLRRCIDSILAQTFTDFELLLIDDGSTDGSGAICDEYAALDSRVRVFHKPNGGVSSARNLGLDNARGEWITFIDSDDWIDQVYFEKIVSWKWSDEADIIISSFKHIHENGEVCYKYPQWYDDKIQGIRTLIISMGGTCVWAKFFKRSILEKYRVKFPVGIRYCEDFYFCATSYIYSNKICYIDSSYDYNYFDRETSVCKNLDDSHIWEAIDMNNKILDLTSEENVRTQYEEHICWRILSCTQDWVMIPQKHKLLISAYPFKKRYILSCPLFWNSKQKFLTFLVLIRLSFGVKFILKIRAILKKTI